MTDQDRAEFEAWARRKDYNTHRHGDEYAFGDLQQMWLCWLAARRTQAEVGYATATKADLEEYARQNCQELCGKDALPVEPARRTQSQQVRALVEAVEAWRDAEIEMDAATHAVMHIPTYDAACEKEQRTRDELVALAAQYKETQDETA